MGPSARRAGETLRRAAPLLALLALFAASVTGCGGATETKRPTSCASRLPGEATPPLPAPPLAMPSSRVLVEVRVDTESMLAALEKSVPKRVADKKGVPMGDAGKLDFSVDRGPFEVGLSGDELGIAVDLEGTAKLCKPVGGLVCVPYASCNPAARGRAHVALVLGSDFRVPGSRVEIPITRRCTLTALELDVTKDLEAEATTRAQQIKDGIDAALPVVEPLVKDTWQALATSVSLGKNTCARVAPTGLVQTGPRLQAGAIRIGVGVVGEVRVESPCKPAAPAPALPRPVLERDAKPGLSLRFPALVSWEEASRAVAQRTIGERLTVNGAEAKVTDARVVPDGPGLRVLLTVVGAACGEVVLRGASLGVDAVRGALLPRLTAPPGVDATDVLAKIVIPLPVELSGMEGRIDKVAKALFSRDTLDPETATLVVKVAPPRLVEALVSEEGLAGVVAAEGEAAVVVHTR